MKINLNFTKGIILIVLFVFIGSYSNAQGLPPISQWSNWTATQQPNANIYYYGYQTSPTNFVGLADYIVNDSWIIGPASTNNNSVSGSSTWTFTAVIAGRCLGDMNNSAGLSLVFRCANSSYTVIPSPVVTVTTSPTNLPQGTFSWQIVSATINLGSNPSSIAYIDPYIQVNGGGGELYVHAVSLIAGSNTDPSLTVPNASLPLSPFNIPAVYSTTNTIPNGWGLWTRNSNPSNVTDSYGYIPATSTMPAYMYARVYNDNDWELSTTANGQNAQYLITGDAEWTFTAVIGGRCLGDMASSQYASIAGVYLGFIVYDANHNVLSYIAPGVSGSGTSPQQGTFGWRMVSTTINISACSSALGKAPAYVTPRFYTLGNTPNNIGAGGGELYVTNASFLPINAADIKLVAPSACGLPLSEYNVPPVYNSAGVTSLPGWVPSNPTGAYVVPYYSNQGEDQMVVSVTKNSTSAWNISPNSPSANVSYPVVNGTAYTFSADIMGLSLPASSSNYPFYLTIQEYNSSNVLIHTTNSSPYYGSFYWTRASVTCTTQATTTHVQVSLNATAGNGEIHVANARLLPMNGAPVNPVITNNQPIVTFPEVAVTNESGHPLSGSWTSWFRCNIDGYSAVESMQDNNENTFPYVALRSYNSADYWLQDQPISWAPYSHYYPVNGQSTWIFTAVISARNVGEIPNGSISMIINGYDANFNGIGACWDSYTFASCCTSSTSLGSTFGWQTINFTYTIPSGCAPQYLVPMFYGIGGGEFFIASASLIPASLANPPNPPTPYNPANLIVPNAPIPQAGPLVDFGYSTQRRAVEKAGNMHLDIPVTATTNNNIGNVYSSGSAISWTITPGLGSSITPNYVIQDGYGNTVTSGTSSTGAYSGTIALGSTITYTPPGTGYYQLVLSGVYTATLTNNGTPYTLPLTLEGKAGVSVGLASSSSYATNSWAWGSNPFGIMGLAGITNASTTPNLYTMLGMTWERPTVFNIIDCNHNDLPSDNALTAEWQAVLTTDAGQVQCYDGINVYNAMYNNAIELYNEPVNAVLIANGNIPSTYGNFEQMVATTQSAVQRYSTNSSKTPPLPPQQIMLNLEHPWFFNNYNNCGATGAVNTYNILSIHPYTQSEWQAVYDVGPEAAVTSHTFYDPWGMPYGLPANLGTIPALLDDIADYKSASSGKPMWTTEFGWPTGEGITTELNQAKYTVRSSLLQLAGGVTKLMPYFCMDNLLLGQFGLFGLFRADQTAKPSLQAYSILAQLVNNLPYAGYFQIGPEGSSNIAYFLFGNNSQTVAVLWNPAQDGVALGTNFIPPHTSAYDMFGKSITYSNIGTAPIYLVINGSSPSVVAEEIENTGGTNALYFPVATYGAPPSTLFNVQY